MIRNNACSTLVADYEFDSSHSDRSPLTTALWQQPLWQKPLGRSSSTVATLKAATLTDALTPALWPRSLWQKPSYNSLLTTTLTTIWQLLWQRISKECVMTMLSEQNVFISSKCEMSASNRSSSISPCKYSTVKVTLNDRFGTYCRGTVRYN